MGYRIAIAIVFDSIAFDLIVFSPFVENRYRLRYLKYSEIRSDPIVVAPHTLATAFSYLFAS